MNRYNAETAARPAAWRRWALGVSCSLSCLLGALMPTGAHALTMEEALSVSAGDNDARIAALQKLLPKNCITH